MTTYRERAEAWIADKGLTSVFAHGNISRATLRDFAAHLDATMEGSLCGAQTPFIAPSRAPEVSGDTERNLVAMMASEQHAALLLVFGNNAVDVDLADVGGAAIKAAVQDARAILAEVDATQEGK